MKKPPTKRQLRHQMQDEIDAYLSRGGRIQEIPQGVSGRESYTGEQRPINQLFDQPRQSRTPIPEVVAALDNRKQTQKSPPKNTGKATAKPRQKIIYDDFGEPVRRVWVED
jgi:hypothetical protein